MRLYGILLVSIILTSFFIPRSVFADTCEQKAKSQQGQTAIGSCSASLNDCQAQGGSYAGNNVEDCTGETPICCAKQPKPTEQVLCATAASVEFGVQNVKQAGCALVATDCPKEQKKVSAKTDCDTQGGVCCATVTAGAGSSGSAITLTNPLGADANLFVIIQRVIRYFLGMVGALALAVFVYASILWMTAGSSDRVQKAQEAMKYAVIGLVLIMFSYTIVSFFFGVLTTAPPTPKAKPDVVGAPELYVPPPSNVPTPP